MIKKIFVVAVVFLFSCCVGVVITDGSEAQKDYIFIEENVVKIEIESDKSKIIIENEEFNISTYFQSYTLARSAICRNLILLQCEDETVCHLSLDIENNILRYMIEKNNKIYYSKIIKNEILFFGVELENNDFYQFLDVTEISPNYDYGKYNYFEESAYKAYICFENLLCEIKETSYSFKSNIYTFTGGSDDEIGVGYEMIDEIFSSSLLSTKGLHYGTVSNDNEIKYIYIVDTDLYIGNKYISKVKIWEVTFDYIGTIYSSLDVNVDLNIVKLYDAFIEGSSTEGKISLAQEGYTYVPMKSISSKISASNYSYISKYKIGYENEEVTVPSYINLGNKILGMFAPYYKKITSITSMVNNFADYLNQSHFDQQLEGYTFISDEYNLKEVGFLVSDSDLGTGIFNDEYLHNYSFYQDITISKVPNYLININAEIKIVLLDNQDQTLTFKSNIEAKNNYNCTHTLIYDNDNSDIHLVNCNNCLYSYHDCHEKLYENQENLGHKV